MYLSADKKQWNRSFVDTSITPCSWSTLKLLYNMVKTSTYVCRIRSCEQSSVGCLVKLVFQTFKKLILFSSIRSFLKNKCTYCSHRWHLKLSIMWCFLLPFGSELSWNVFLRCSHATETSQKRWEKKNRAGWVQTCAWSNWAGLLAAPVEDRFAQVS